MSTCIECGRQLLLGEPEGACMPCVVGEMHRLEDRFALADIARRGKKYFNELRVNIQTALEDRHG